MSDKEVDHLSTRRKRSLATSEDDILTSKRPHIDSSLTDNEQTTTADASTEGSSPVVSSAAVGESKMGDHVSERHEGNEPSSSLVTSTPSVQPSDSDEGKDMDKTSGDSGLEEHRKTRNYRPHLSPSHWSQSDTSCYRMKYPGKEDDLTLEDNYKFYANETPSKPDGDFINTIHKDWWGQYDKLEYHHGYIQWLFPIRERGLNYHSQELQLHEIKKICASEDIHKKVLISYELMLDFYGMKLKDRNTGEIQRAKNWKERFDHLNHSSHNYLRITRILKCLGEMNYEHLKAPFLKFVLHEAIVEGTLDRTLDSCMNYWVEVLRDDQEREDIKKRATSLADEINKSIDEQYGER